MEDGRISQKVKKINLVVKTVVLLLYMIIIYLNLSYYGKRYALMVASIVFLSTFISLIVFHNNDLTRIKRFQTELWKKNEYFCGDGLIITLKIGQVIIKEEHLSEFVESITRDYYIIKLPYFNWDVEVQKSLIPFKLKAGYRKNYWRTRERNKSPILVDFLNLEKKNQIHVILFILFQMLLVSIFHLCATRYNSLFVNGYHVTLVLIRLMMYLFIVYVICYVTKRIVKGFKYYKEGIGVPKVEGNYYRYSTLGNTMVVNLSNRSVSMKYLKKRSLLITDIKGFRYFKTVEPLKYERFIHSK